MKSILNTRNTLMILGLLILSSCGLKEFTNFEDVSIKGSPEFVAPLAYGNISMQSVIDMMGEDSLIGKNGDNVMIISFVQKDIFNYAVKDMLSFDSKIDLIKDKELIKIDETINNIINDFELVHVLTLGDLLSELSGDIAALKNADGLPMMFPKYTYNPVTPTEFNTGVIDDFETVTFSSGQIKVSLTNNLPVYGIDVDAELWDNKLNKSIGTIKFGYDKLYAGYELYYGNDWFGTDGIGLPGSISTDGGAPGSATDQTIISLTNVTISNDIAVRLKYFATRYGSGNKTPIINFAKGLDFKIEFDGAQVNSGKFKVPAKSITGNSEKLSNIKISKDIDLHKAVINSGTLSIVMKKTLPISGSLYLAFPTIMRNNQMVSTTKNFGSGSESLFTVDLSGAEIDFSENATNIYNTLYYSYLVQISPTLIDYNKDNTITFDISISDLDIKSAEGNFGQITQTINESEFNLSLDILDQLKGDFVFLDPSIKLVINNSALEAPATVNLDLTGYNKSGESVKLGAQPFTVPVPNLPTETSKTGEIVINKDNSAIVDFISLPPTDRIAYSGNIKINPDGIPNANNLNYVEMNGKIGFDLEVEIPLHFQTSKISFSDTINFSLSEIPAMVSSAELLIRADNGLPLGVELELSFVDSISGTVYGDEVKVMLLEAAKVDDNGKTTAPSSSTSSIALTSNNFPEYRKANAIIFVANIATPEKGAKPAKLSTTDGIYLNIGFKAGINFSNK